LRPPPRSVKTKIQALSNPDRQNQQGQTLLVKPPLQGEYRVIVQQAREERLLPEDKLPAKENRIGKPGEDVRGDLDRFFDDIVPKGGKGFRLETPGAHVVDITLVGGVDVPFEILHLGGAFEVACVQDADLDEQEVLENAGKKPEHAEERVEA